VGEVFKTFLNVEKASRGLGWQPSITLDEGLRQTVEYFRTRL